MEELFCHHPPAPTPQGHREPGVSARSRISLLSPAGSLRNATLVSSPLLGGCGPAGVPDKAALATELSPAPTPKSALHAAAQRAAPLPGGPLNIPSRTSSAHLLRPNSNDTCSPRSLESLALPSSVCGSPEVSPRPSLVLTAIHRLRGLTADSCVPHFSGTHAVGPDEGLPER